MDIPVLYIEKLLRIPHNRTAIFHAIKSDYINHDQSAIEFCKSIDGDNVNDRTFQKATDIVITTIDRIEIENRKPETGLPLTIGIIL